MTVDKKYVYTPVEQKVNYTSNLHDTKQMPIMKI